MYTYLYTYILYIYIYTCICIITYIYTTQVHIHVYIYTMHAYIHIYSIHAHIYIYMDSYTCTHCMVTTTPHAATLLHQSSNTHTALYIYTYKSYKHIHTHTLSVPMHILNQTITILWHYRASTKVCRLCTCPASTPFEHASSDRHDCRLTGLAPPRYPGPASTLSSLQSYSTYICQITHTSCSVTTLS